MAVRLNVNINVLKKEMKANRKKAVSALKATMGCKFCPAQFKTSVEQARHLVSHLKNELTKDLPASEPYKCPKCEWGPGSTKQALLMHYGTGHPQVSSGLHLATVGRVFFSPKLMWPLLFFG